MPVVSAHFRSLLPLRYFNLLTPLATRPCVSKTLMLSVDSDVAIEIGDEAK